MKNYLSLKSVCGLAVVVLMTSCVAKKKYTEAQNTITTLQTENAQLKETGTSLQQNLATLQTTNTTLQSRIDSTNTWVTGQQSRWNSFQAFYDEGTRTTEQVHQMLHTQLDNLVGAENITTSGGRIYVNLAEKTLFASGSSKLSTKGADVLTALAQAIKENPNVEIDIAASPGYYTAGNMTAGSMDNGMNNSSNSNMNNQNNQSTTTNKSNMNNNQSTTTNSDARIKQEDDLKYKDANTKIKADKDGDVKVKMHGNKSNNNSGSYANRSASSSYSGSAKTKSSANRSTARKSSEATSKSYSSSPSRKASVSSSSTWSLNIARSGAIAKKLVDEGVAKSRILVNSDNTSSSTGTKDFQVIISPKADTYYNSLGNGGNTSGGMNK